MKLDLERLGDVHPVLPKDIAAAYTLAAALALQRRHASGVSARATVGDESSRAILQWTTRPMRDAAQLDDLRVTENGAEAVALSLAHEAQRWVVVRRLQRGEHADWLLRDAETRRLVRLEVSGTDAGDGVARLADKLGQVGRSGARCVRAACVVGFREPHIALAFVPDRS